MYNSVVFSIGCVELVAVNSHHGWKNEKTTSKMARDFNNDENENFFNIVNTSFV